MKKTTYVLFVIAEKKTFDWWSIAEVIVFLAGSIFPRKEHED